MSDLPVYSTSSAHLARLLADKVKPAQPSFFRVTAQLPSQGRTDTPVAASEKLAVMVKAYAGTGENEMHAHINEDHLFVVLQGTATFYGPRSEERHVRQHDGVMLPRGSFYRFRATSAEPLVMLRVGCPVEEGKPRTGRIDIDGQPMDGHSEQNKEVPVILSGALFAAA